MEYVYAALLLDAAGKEVTEQSLMDIVKAAGMTPDEARAKAMVASLKGVNIKDIIKNAQSMQTAAAAPQAQQEGAHQKAQKKPEEEKKSEEEATTGLAGLFG
jgi:large subunit ribosomal protein L12